MLAQSKSSSPVSVLRKAHSSNCLRNLNSSNDTNTNNTNNHNNTVTIINTEYLPSYSTERYYILSELQLNAHSISFLSDWNDNEEVDQGPNHNVDVNNQSSINSDENTHENMSFSSSDGGFADDSSSFQDVSLEGINHHHHHHPVALNNNSNNDDDVYTTTAQKIDKEELLPPYIILYILYKPHSSQLNSTTIHQQGEFIDQTIIPSVEKIIRKYQHQQYNLMSSIQNNQSNKNSSVSNLTNDDCMNDNDNITKPFPSIYIVVDQLSLPLTNVLNDEHHSSASHEAFEVKQTQPQNHEVDFATLLIRKVITLSKTSYLRHVIEGITVGISSNVRAAPGLEACMDSILVGHAERRSFAQTQFSDQRILSFKSKNINKNNSNSTYEQQFWTKPDKSHIGLITIHPDHLLGFDHTRETDAVQNLKLHLRICGEYFGKGNILSFATRSQIVWRRTVLTRGDTNNYRSVIDDNHSLSLQKSSSYDSLLPSKSSSSDFVSVVEYSDLDRFVNPSSISMRRRKRLHERLGQKFNNVLGYGEGSNSKYLPSRQKKQQVDTITNIMVALFLMSVAFYIKIQYGDMICEYFDQIVLSKISY